MLFESIHMVSETTGWGTGAPKGQKDFMGANVKRCIFHTTDGGCHWKTIKTLDHPLCFTTFFLSESTAWVAINHHLIHTSNAGTTWEEFALPLASDEPAWITHLGFLDAHTGWFIAPSALTETASSLFYTNDGGKNWSQLPRMSGESSSFPGWTRGLTFHTTTTGWMTSGSLLFITRDGGRTWQPQTLPLPAGLSSFNDLTLQTPRFFSVHEGLLSACINRFDDSTRNGFVVFVTHDGGQSWQSQPFILKDYNPVLEKKCRAMEEKRMKEEAKSRGDTTFWRVSTSFTYMHTPAPQFTDMRFGWVGHPSLEISITNDGGEHWEELNLHTLPERDEQIQFINRRVGWNLSRGKEDYFSQWCHKTTDGGKT